MEQISLGTITIDVVRKKIKNMYLAVHPPTGRVRIAVPLFVGTEAARLFAISRLAWIKQNQQKFREQERLSPGEYKERESHYFFGRRYLLRILEQPAPGKIVVANKTYLDMYIKAGLSTIEKQEILNTWYRKELKKIIPHMVIKWEKRIGVKAEAWGIRQMKTLWGSCNIQRRRILLNLELAKKPVECLEYILVHELIHLLERHHNEKFKNHMDSFLPNWRHRKDQLNRLPVSHAEWKY